MKTTTDPETLTDDQIRVAIAERMGWSFDWTGAGCHVGPHGGYDEEHPTDWFAREQDQTTGDFLTMVGVPNYPADLNAMHEAEKVMTPEQWCAYATLLFMGVDTSKQYTFAATARQRSIAFLRTFQP